MNAKQVRLLRWLALAVIAGVAGWALYRLGVILVSVASIGSASFLRLLLAAYASLVAGYLFSAVLTPIAPGRRYTAAVGLVFVVVVVAATLMLQENDAGPIPSVLLGLSLVVGSFGYALRVRGFSEAVSTRDS